MAAISIPNITGGGPQNPGTGNTVVGESTIAFDTTSDTLKTFDGTTLTEYPSTVSVSTLTNKALTSATLTSPVINTPTIKDLTESPTTTNVLLAGETGSVFFLTSATGFAHTLPAVAAGLHFTFIVATAPTSGSHTVACASGTLIKGHVLTNDVNSATDSDFGTAGEATLTFVVNKAVAGDKAEFYCDGTNWFVSAACSVFDAITIS